MFFGLVFNAQGVHPDPGKVKDIEQIPAPSDAKQLMEFLGIATYMSPFIPHLSQNTAPLRDLLKKGTEFVWSASHQMSFEKVKQLICQEVMLSYFDPHKESKLQVDASSRGIGAVLLQDGKPISFSSKSLSDCEQRYANIEREMLAVVYGCEKFHTCILVWQTLCGGIGSQTLGNDPSEKSLSSSSKTTKDASTDTALRSCHQIPSWEGHVAG